MLEEKISRRNFLKLSAGAAAFAMLPSYAIGGNKMSAEKSFVIKNVKYFTPSGEVETGNIFIDGDKISKISTGEVDAKNFSTVICSARFCECTHSRVNDFAPQLLGRQGVNGLA